MFSEASSTKESNTGGEDGEDDDMYILAAMYKRRIQGLMSPQAYKNCSAHAALAADSPDLFAQSPC
ncbi:hypothetical protein GB937_009502 [Aspergillus fischeri]|nr:hypothetical protein GB937_009502 [Aspergillus fischeri]